MLWGRFLVFVFAGIFLFGGLAHADAQLTEIELQATEPMMPYLGQEVRVQGRVAAVETDKFGHQKAIMPSADGFHLFIRKQARDQIGRFDMNQFKGQSIAALGQVAVYQGKPHIVIAGLGQIETLAKSAPVAPVPAAEATRPAGKEEAPNALFPSLVESKQNAVHALLVESNQAGLSHGLCKRLTGTATDIKVELVRQHRSRVPYPVASSLGTSIQYRTTTRTTRAPSKLAFNQEVGDSMGRSIGEVERFFKTRRSEAFGLGIQGGIIFGFEDKWVPKDGPSAALALALVTESMAAGVSIPDNIAVTGDLNADGSVQPIGGLVEKLVAARKAGMRMALIPADNVPELFDLAIDGHWDVLRSLHVIGVSDFEQAWDFITAEASSDLTKSLENYEAAVRENLVGKQLADKMVEVAGLNPQHASAYLLYLHGANQLPSHYSLRGSMARIAKVFQPFASMAQASRGSRLPQGLSSSNLYSATTWELRDLRKKVDKRTRPYIDALNDYIELAKAFPTMKTDRYGRSSDSAKANSLRRDLNEVLARMEEAERAVMASPDFSSSK